MGIFSDDGQLHRIEERLARVEEKLDRLLSQQSQQGLSGQDLSRAMGEVESLIEKAAAMGQCWLRGIGVARRLAAVGS